MASKEISSSKPEMGVRFKVNNEITEKGVRETWGWFLRKTKTKSLVNGNNRSQFEGSLYQGKSSGTTK